MPRPSIIIRVSPDGSDVHALLALVQEAGYTHMPITLTGIYNDDGELDWYEFSLPA